MNRWEKTKVVSVVIAAVAAAIVPIVLGIIAHRYTQAFKEREIQGKFVELAVQILNQEPSAEERNLREWATQLLASILACN